MDCNWVLTGFSMVVLAWVGLGCILNCSRMVNVADKAFVLWNFTVICNQQIALPFTSQGSVSGGLQVVVR